MVRPLCGRYKMKECSCEMNVNIEFVHVFFSFVVMVVSVLLLGACYNFALEEKDQHHGKSQKNSQVRGRQAHDQTQRSSTKD